ncbi:MAG TPA: hypothetical protein VK549_18790 [Acidimicrobiia bacterium]|nr:hypothetical protein [Acidimicrobiia bacterium]
MSETDAWTTSCRPTTSEPADPWTARFNERCDRFERDLLELIDRRLRTQIWMMLATVVVVGGVLVAAIRL